MEITQNPTAQDLRLKAESLLKEAERLETKKKMKSEDLQELYDKLIELENQIGSLNYTTQLGKIVTELELMHKDLNLLIVKPTSKSQLVALGEREKGLTLSPQKEDPPPSPEEKQPNLENFADNKRESNVSLVRILMILVFIIIAGLVIANRLKLI